MISVIAGARYGPISDGAVALASRSEWPSLSPSILPLSCIRRSRHGLVSVRADRIEIPLARNALELVEPAVLELRSPSPRRGP